MWFRGCCVSVSGLLTVRETADAAHLSQRTVRRLVASGVLESIRPGPRSIRIWAASVADLLTRGYPGVPAKGGER